MNVAPTSVGGVYTRSQARRGLALYLVAVVLLTTVFDILLLLLPLVLGGIETSG
jgi:hypothetical protein